MPHVPDRHADHDPLAIAAYAAGDAAGPALDGAIARVAACPDCALLHHDLRAIAAALPTLPAPARPRDFRLTPDEAAALRPAGWRRWLAPLAGPRFAFAGPLGAGLATLGIAGILVAGVAGAPVAPAAGGAWDAAASGEAGLAAPELAPAPSGIPRQAAETDGSAMGPSIAASEAPASAAPAPVAPASEAPASEAPASPAPATRYLTIASVPPGSPAATAGGDTPPGSGPAASADVMTGAAGGQAASLPSSTAAPKDAIAAPPVATRDAFSSADGRLTGPAAPLAAVAIVLLAAGVLLGGLRLAARRLA